MKMIKNTLHLFLSLGIVSAALTVGLGFPSSTMAEFYAGAMGGYAAPNDFSDIQMTTGGTEISLPDFDLDNSFMAGGKVGYYLPTQNWLGVETEAFYTNPDFSAGGNLQVITWAMNAMVRYPGTRFQPYGGVGLGVLFARAEHGGHSSWDMAVPGFNALAGLRAFVTDSIAVFGEYKYSRASFNFDASSVLGFPVAGSIDGDYSANMAVGGLSFHF